MKIFRCLWAWCCDVQLARLVRRADAWSARREAAVRAQVLAEQRARRRRVARRSR